jgi:hypothetical protein
MRARIITPRRRHSGLSSFSAAFRVLVTGILVIFSNITHVVLAEVASGVTKTVINEISDPSNIADIFSIMPLVWSIAAIMACVLFFPLSYASHLSICPDLS